jgi:oligoribonuclease
MVVTDENLNVISPEFDIVINQSDEVISNMNDWCKENLKDLAVASKESKISEIHAEEMMLKFISEHVPPKKAPLAGNTIYMDRMFLKKYFSKVDDYLHYRIIDVSTVKELCGRWNRKVYDSAPRKELKHRALDDIRESIAEMKYYKDNFFVLRQ